MVRRRRKHSNNKSIKVLLLLLFVCLAAIVGVSTKYNLFVLQEASSTAYYSSIEESTSSSVIISTKKKITGGWIKFCLDSLYHDIIDFDEAGEHLEWHRAPRTTTTTITTNTINNTNNVDDNDNVLLDMNYEISTYENNNNQMMIPVVPFLKSIPSSRRVPKDQINNATWLQQRASDRDNSPLYTYYPTLLSLHDPSLSSDIKHKINGRWAVNNSNFYTEEEINSVSYLAVFRVSNLGGNIRRTHEFNKHYQNYLGLALLDDEFQVLDEAIFQKRNKKEDCQVLAAPTDILTSTSTGGSVKNALFLLCNEILTPIDIRRNKSSSSQIKAGGDVISPKYGSGIELFWLSQDSYIDFGKNFHIFQSEGVNFIELWPHGKHETRAIYLTHPLTNGAAQHETDVFPHVTLEHQMDFDIKTKELKKLFYQPMIRSSTGLIRSNESEPNRSFNTTESVEDFNLSYKRRGTACCLDMEIDNIKVKVGISHGVSIHPQGFPRSYVSQFYAFEDKAPFKIVALSGYFCLPYANNDTDRVDDGNVFVTNTTTTSETSSNICSSLQFRNSELIFDSCPQVHFPSGIVEMAGVEDDNSFAVISYGVMDTYSRYIQVPKKQIYNMLKPKRCSAASNVESVIE